MIDSQFNTGTYSLPMISVSIYLIQSLPFGGVKESGFGRFVGPEGLRACCVERSIVIVADHIPGVRTTIPSAIDLELSRAYLYA